MNYLFPKYLNIIVSLNLKFHMIQNPKFRQSIQYRSDLVIPYNLISALSNFIFLSLAYSLPVLQSEGRPHPLPLSGNFTGKNKISIQQTRYNCQIVPHPAKILPWSVPHYPISYENSRRLGNDKIYISQPSSLPLLLCPFPLRSDRVHKLRVLRLPK